MADGATAADGCGRGEEHRRGRAAQDRRTRGPSADDGSPRVAPPCTTCSHGSGPRDRRRRPEGADGDAARGRATTPRESTTAGPRAALQRTRPTTATIGVDRPDRRRRPAASAAVTRRRRRRTHRRRSLFDRRDDLLLPVEKSLSRVLKRLASDEQNEILDRLRRVKRGRPDPAEMLPSADTDAVRRRAHGRVHPRRERRRRVLVGARRRRRRRHSSRTTPVGAEVARVPRRGVPVAAPRASGACLRRGRRGRPRHLGAG